MCRRCVLSIVVSKFPLFDPDWIHAHWNTYDFIVNDCGFSLKTKAGASLKKSVSLGWVCYLQISVSDGTEGVTQYSL